MQHMQGKNFCEKCGSANSLDARYCRICGFFLAEPTSDPFAKKEKSPPIAPPSTIEIPDETPKMKLSEICPRCGNSVEGLEKCALCGLLAPMEDETPDDFLGDIIVLFPTLLTNPEKFVDILPYKRGLATIITPILWSTFVFAVFWIIIYVSGSFTPKLFIGAKTSIGVFLLITTAIIVVVVPFIIAAYILLMHAASMLLGGRGIIERVTRSLCAVLFGFLLFSGSMLALYHISVTMKQNYEFYLSDSPWRDHYFVIPLVLKLLMYFGWLYLLIIQVRILARVHYFDIGRSVFAHALTAIIPIAYFLLKRAGYI